MCLIIQRPAGVTLDKDGFMTATTVNPDGYGLSVADGDGKLYTQKAIKYDAEELYNLIHGDFKDSEILLHLRYTTAGDTTVRNAHPFPILEFANDGADLRMAHNGTIHRYKPALNAPNKWESDTRSFVREFVRPLFKRLSAGWHCSDLLDDKFVHDILSDKIPGGSVLAFLDGHGNKLIVNEKGNGGYTNDEGVYFSNKYSFNASHRTPSTTTYSQGWAWGDKEDVIPFGGKGGATNRGGVLNSKAKEIANMSKDTSQMKFSKKHNVDPDELLVLTDDLLDEIVDDKPDDAKLLLRELMAMLQEKGLENNALRAKLKNLSTKAA